MPILASQKVANPIEGVNMRRSGMAATARETTAGRKMAARSAPRPGSRRRFSSSARASARATEGHADVGHGQRDQARAADAELPGRQVGSVAKLVDGRHHPAASVAGNVRVAVNNVGNRLN